MRKTKRQHRWLALALCLCLLASIFPLTGMTYAAETGCSHVHDEFCGYTETEGKSCTFRHEHDDTCGWAETVEAAPCQMEAEHVHDEFCGYVETAAGAPCTHVHDADCGGLSQNYGSLPCAKTEGCTLPIGHEGDCNVAMLLTDSDTKYFPGDVTVINDIIEKNNLDWDKDRPESWPTSRAVRVVWTNDATNKRIRILELPQHGLTGMLNVTGLSSLETLKCNGNDLDGLNASNLSKLKTLDCSNNAKMNTLTVSGCSALESLDFSGTSLTSLNAADLVGLSNLLYLFCAYGKLTALDVSGLTNLQQLICMGNPFQSLNLPGGKKLTVKVSPENSGTVVLDILLVRLL